MAEACQGGLQLREAGGGSGAETPTAGQIQYPAEAFVIGTTATIRPVKGIDLLLEAAITCADLKDIYFLIVGPLKDRKVARLLQDDRIRERVRQTGFQPNAAELSRAMDVFVMPSRQESGFVGRCWKQ